MTNYVHVCMWKTTSHGHPSGNVDDVQRRSRFAQKGHNIETKAYSSQWKSICYDCGDKRKIETGAVDDTKTSVSEVFQVYYI